MAEDRGRGRERDDHNRHRQAEHRSERSQQHDHASVVAVQEKPSSPGSSIGEAGLPGSLLGNSVLNGRGNTPVKIALMQQMQQTHGNRSIQRFLRSRPTNAGGNTTTSSSSSLDVARAPTPTGPVPIPYPNLGVKWELSELDASKNEVKGASGGIGSPAPEGTKDASYVSNRARKKLKRVARKAKGRAGTLRAKFRSKLKRLARKVKRKGKFASAQRSVFSHTPGFTTHIPSHGYTQRTAVQRCGPVPCNCSAEEKAAKIQKMPELSIMRTRAHDTPIARGPPAHDSSYVPYNYNSHSSHSQSRSAQRRKNGHDFSRLLKVSRTVDVVRTAHPQNTPATLHRIDRAVSPALGVAPQSTFSRLGNVAASLQRFVSRASHLPIQRIDIPNPLDAAKKLAEKALGAIKDLGSSAYNTAKSLGESALNGAVSAGTSAWNTIKGTGSSIFNTARNMAQNAWNTAKSMGSSAWNTVKGLATQVWNSARSAGQKAWSAAKDLGGKAWSFAKSAGQKAWNGAKGLGMAAWNGARSLGSKAWNGAKDFAGRAWNGVKSFGGKVWNGVKGAAGKAWEGAKKLGGKAVEVARSVAGKLSPKDLCKGVGKLLASAYNKVSPYVKKAWAGAKKLGGMAWDSAKKLGGKLWDTAKDWGGKAAAFVKNAIGKATSKVKDLVGKAWEGAKKLGGDVLNGAKSYASKAWDTAKSLGSNAWNSAKSAAASLYNRARSLGGAAWDTAKGLAGRAWDTAKSLGNSISSRARNAANGLLSIANKLTGGAAGKVAGMAQKILSKASGLLASVMSVARDMANKALNAAKSFASKALDKAKEWGGKLLNGAKDYATRAWNKAKELGTSAINTAKDLAGKAWAFAKEKGGQAISAAKDLAGKAWAVAKDLGGRALAVARDWGGKAWNVAKKYGGDAWTAIKDWGGKAWSVAKGAGSKVLAFAKKMGGKATDFARKIGLDKAWKTAKDLGAKAYKIVKDAVAKIDLKKTALGLAAILGIPLPAGSVMAALATLRMIGKSQCVLAMAPAVAGPMRDIEQNSPMIERIHKVMENPEMIVEATKTSIGGMIAKVGPEAESQVTKVASRYGPPMQKHLGRILFYLRAGIVDLGNTWWDQLKKMGRGLLFPWEGMGEELKSMWGDIKGAVGSFLKLDFSTGLDHILSMLRTLNGVLGNWFGWFTIASVVVGGVLGALGGPAAPATVPAGMGAGLAFAGSVGEGLLIALAVTELASISKAGADLMGGKQTEAQDEDDHKQIANSSITLGITGVMVLLSALAARFAKAVFGRLKGLFKDMKAPKGEGPSSGEMKPGGEKPGGLKAAEWERSLSPETRELLNANPELRRMWETMDPEVRRLLTKCASPCIPKNATPQDIQRIQALLKRLDIPGDHAALKDYFHKAGLEDGGLSKAIDALEKAIAEGKAEKGTLAGDLWRYQRYRAAGGKLPYDEWYKVSRGGRSGGPGHQAIQNSLADATRHPGATAEMPVPGTNRVADAYWPKGVDGKGKPTYHQIGGRNPVRGDPIARERAAIEDIRKAVGGDADIYFWDKTNPGAAPMVNPDLKPDWVPATRGD